LACELRLPGLLGLARELGLLLRDLGLLRELLPRLLIVTHFEHQPANTPYRASHAIYVRKGEKTYDAVDQVPEQLRLRLLSVRAFDHKGLMVSADVVDGKELEGAIERLLGDDRADYLHVHYAKPGCYAARIERA
jgi:hypothetical protein